MSATHWRLSDKAGRLAYLAIAKGKDPHSNVWGSKTSAKIAIENSSVLP